MAVGVDQAGYHRGTVQPHHRGTRFRRGAHAAGADRGDPAIAHQHAPGGPAARGEVSEAGTLDNQLHPQNPT